MQENDNKTVPSHAEALAVPTAAYIKHQYLIYAPVAQCFVARKPVLYLRIQLRWDLSCASPRQSAHQSSTLKKTTSSKRAIVIGLQSKFAQA